MKALQLFKTATTRNMQYYWQQAEAARTLLIVGPLLLRAIPNTCGLMLSQLAWSTE
jgi:hypothetical protein